MDNTQGVVIAMGVGLGLVLLYGIYRLAMSRFSSSNTLRPGTSASNGRQAVKAIFAIIATIALFAAMFFAYDYFVHQ